MIPDVSLLARCFLLLLGGGGSNLKRTTKVTFTVTHYNCADLASIEQRKNRPLDQFLTPEFSLITNETS